MSKCSRELDAVFSKISRNAEMMKKLNTDSQEWRERRSYSINLYYKAKNIFKHYHPDYEDEEPKTAGGACD